MQTSWYLQATVTVYAASKQGSFEVAVYKDYGGVFPSVLSKAVYAWSIYTDQA